MPSNIKSHKLHQPVTYCIYKVTCKYSYQETTLIGESGDTDSISNELKENYIVLMYIQQDAILHSIFYLETCLYVSGGTSTHHQERKKLYLQHLVFVRPLLRSAAIVADSSNGVTNTRCCRYRFLRS
jgi:hypothetical protein